MLSRLNVFRAGLLLIMAASAWFAGWVASELGVSEAGPMVVTLLAATGSSLFFIPAIFLFVSSFATFAADPSSGALIIPHNSGYYRLMKEFYGDKWHPGRLSGCAIFWKTVWVGVALLVVVVVVAFLAYLLWGFAAGIFYLSRGVPLSQLKDMEGGGVMGFWIISLILALMLFAVMIASIGMVFGRVPLLAAFFRALKEHSCPVVLVK
ncbi:MAG: hypothetical protein HYT22_01740 [Candidatus Niyogibacteria bacterium]|nr:hypothetical protein [Candidatus Niyogibacteria bacterium]